MHFRWLIKTRQKCSSLNKRWLKSRVILVRGLRRTKYNIADIIGHSIYSVSSPPACCPKHTHSHTHTVGHTPFCINSVQTTSRKNGLMNAETESQGFTKMAMRTGLGKESAWPFSAVRNPFRHILDQRLTRLLCSRKGTGLKLWAKAKR